MKKVLDDNTKINGLQFWKFLRVLADDRQYGIVYVKGPNVFCVKKGDKIVNGKVPLYRIHNTLFENMFTTGNWTNGTMEAWVEVE